MQLCALGVEGFRCFRSRFALEPIAPGITIVSGPNEAGKSTLFLALAHALLTHHRTAGRAIEELRPFGTLVSPRVWVVLELGGSGRPAIERQTLRVSKQFLEGRSCRIERVLPAGLDPLAEGDAAEELLHSLLGSRAASRGPGRLADWGIAELLWVPQGASGLPVIPGQELQARLRAGAGGGALAARDAALCDRIEACYREVYQEKRGDARRGSELARRRRRVIDLRIGLSQLASRRALLEEASARLEEASRRRATLSAREDELRDEASGLQERVGEQRRKRAIVERASARHAAARSGFEAVELFRQRLVGLQAGLREQELLVETLTRRQTSLERELDEQLLRYAALRKEQAEAESEGAELERRGERARLRAELETLERRIRRLRDLGKQREELEAAERRAPSAEELADAEAAWAAMAEARGGAELRLRLSATRALRARIGGVARELRPGEELEERGFGALELEIEETARLAVAIGGHDPARLAELEAAYRGSLAPFEAGDLSELRALHLEARRRGALRARIEAEAASLLDPGGSLDSLEQTARALADRPELSRAGPEPEPQLRFSFSFEDVRARARRISEQLQEVQAALEELRRAEGELAMERQLGERSRQSAQRDLDEVISRFGSIERLQERWGEARRALDEARSELAAVEQPAEPGARDPELRLEEIRLEREALEHELRELRDREVSSQTRLEDAGREGLHEQEARQAEELEREERELEREEQRARGTRLLTLLARRTREELAAALVEPIARELGRYLARVTGREEREVILDETFRLRGVRDGASSSLEEVLGAPFGLEQRSLLAPEQLSGGTREQLSLIYRLALGRALAAEQRLPVVLDDPLGETDADRQGRLLELIDAESDHLQILILTCHPERYAALPRKTVLSL